MTQTTLGLKSFFNGDPLTLEEHKMLPYRITRLGKENEETISRIENTTWMTELVDEYGEDPDQYESEIEEVVEMLIDGETIRDDIEAYVDDTRFGVEELYNFKKYTEACEEWTLHVVNAPDLYKSIDDMECPLLTRLSIFLEVVQLLNTEASVIDVCFNIVSDCFAVD
jgi:hypothetical protein